MQPSSSLNQHIYKTWNSLEIKMSEMNGINYWIQNFQSFLLAMSESESESESGERDWARVTVCRDLVMQLASDDVFLDQLVFFHLLLKLWLVWHVLYWPIKWWELLEVFIRIGLFHPIAVIELQQWVSTTMQGDQYLLLDFNSGKNPS